MKLLLASVLLLAYAVIIDGQATQRATRATAATKAGVTRPGATRPGPTRQSVAITRPGPTRSVVANGPTRQQGAAPQPTRGIQPGNTPPVPTRTPSGQTVPIGQPNPWSPPPAINPVPPTVPVALPSLPPHMPDTPNNRPSTRPPRISDVGVPDHRCPISQDIRNPVHLPHHSNCERFFKCDHGLAFEYQCPIGQHWNTRRNFCDFPANANCGGGNWNNGVNHPDHIWNNNNNWNNGVNNNNNPGVPDQNWNTGNNWNNGVNNNNIPRVPDQNWNTGHNWNNGGNNNWNGGIVVDIPVMDHNRNRLPNNVHPEPIWENGVPTFPLTHSPINQPRQPIWNNNIPIAPQQPQNPIWSNNFPMVNPIVIPQQPQQNPIWNNDIPMFPGNPVNIPVWPRN